MAVGMYTTALQGKGELQFHLLMALKGDIMASDLRDEVWQDIPGYKFYQASTLGRIRAKERFWVCGNGAQRYSPEKILSLGNGADRMGHLHCTLTEDGIAHWLSVHRLIALTFIPNPENKPQVDHINRDPKDNRVTNLRWVTAKENCANRSYKDDRRKH